MLGIAVAFIVIACRPAAPGGYYDHCDPSGVDTAMSECADGSTCLDYYSGAWCTVACAADVDCPETGSGRPTRCVDEFCREDEPTD